MKYWRGYLTAGFFAFLAWALSQFAKSHEVLMDAIYPYISRMIQTTLSGWTGGVEYCLWQLLLVVFAVVVLASIVLMLVLKWNPIQWLGWVLAVVCAVFALNTGIYGLNQYAGSLADDIKLELQEYSVEDLKDAAVYYRDKANALAELVSRDSQSQLDFGTLAELNEVAPQGFHVLVYDRYFSIFAGSMDPVKELGWADWFSSAGTTELLVPLTAEAAVNPQTPDLGLPFALCRVMCQRMALASDTASGFGAFLACQANSDIRFQYSGYVMAYRSCYDALSRVYSSAGAQAAVEVDRGVSDCLRQDMAQYDSFFSQVKADTAVALTEQFHDTYQTLSSDPELVASYGETCDLLVSWYIQEEVIPNQVVEEENKFDPFDPNQVDLGDLVR